MLKTQKIEYHDGTTLLEGHYAYNDSIPGKKPAVLVCHDWSGRNDFADDKAKKLAELGYIGFALDMYGKDKTGNTKEEKIALMQPLMQDRSKLLQRITAAFTTVKKLDQVDTANIAAIGFCFGGLCVLDLARGGAALKGVVSFHGLLQAPENAAHHAIQAKILALHGYADPMVTPEHVMAFADEMTAAKVDWQLDIYGNVKHAFTNPQANDDAFGTVYNKKADARSWLAMREFLKEVFGN
jgi:dienelactone hydrolase